MNDDYTFMMTASGKRFYFGRNFEQNKIDIEDIARALSNICRFGGHCRFYSVAEHSVLVSKLLPKEFALAGLLHDATEAYIGDMVSPLKYFLDQYRDIENAVADLISKEFNVDFNPPEIKHADLTALYIEASSLHGEDMIKDWGIDAFQSNKRLDLHSMPPEAGYQLFMRRFKELTA